jgi:hypothetical protein
MKFAEVESKRHEGFSDSSNAAAYFVLVFDSLSLDSIDFSLFADQNRAIGLYTVLGDKSWHSRQGELGFAPREGNGFAHLLQDILFDCMGKGQKDVGDFSKAYATVQAYFEWGTGCRAFSLEIQQIGFWKFAEERIVGTRDPH